MPMMANTGGGQLAGAPSLAPRATYIITSRLRIPVYGMKPSDMTSHKSTPNDLMTTNTEYKNYKDRDSGTWHRNNCRPILTKHPSSSRKYHRGRLPEASIWLVAWLCRLFCSNQICTENSMDEIKTHTVSQLRFYKSTESEVQPVNIPGHSEVGYLHHSSGTTRREQAISRRDVAVNEMQLFQILTAFCHVDGAL